ncbi:MAG: YqeG family HAD IIIA-type phosphatase [Firmicutes bacterium]|nr:YqeG family HAD IIIA-type phosphatase [Bacillota bacterium]
MWARFRPHARVASVAEITPGFLRERGLSALVLDLDNTLAPWNGLEAAPGVAEWLASLQAAGVALVVLSNNSPRRVETFARRWGLVALPRAGKPRRQAFHRALAVLGSEVACTAVVGDRLLMDVWGGRRAGLYTVLVEPVDRRELWATRLVRRLEEAVDRRLGAAGT